MVKEFEGYKPRSLRRMSLKQLKEELSFSRGILYGCDREDEKLHRDLHFRVKEVQTAISRVERGLPPVDDDYEE